MYSLQKTYGCFVRLSLIVASSIYVIFVIKSRIGGWGGIGETILAMSGFESPKVQNTPPCLASSCNLCILVELWKKCDRGVVQVAAIFARQVADRAGCHCSRTPTGGWNTWWQARFILRGSGLTSWVVSKATLKVPPYMMTAGTLYRFIALWQTSAHDLAGVNQTLPREPNTKLF